MTETKMGRPTDYREDFPDKALLYLKTCLDESLIPWIEDLAYLLGVDDDTIVEWCKKYPNFSASIKKLMTAQKSALKKAGIGARNSSMSIFLLKANHGFIETQRVEHSGEVGINLSFEDALKLLKKKDDTGAIPSVS